MKHKQFSMINKPKHGKFFLIKVLVVVFVLMFSVVVIYDRVSTSPVDSSIALKHLKLFIIEKTQKIKPYFPAPNKKGVRNARY